METVLSIKTSASIYAFKSYYVVWKQKMEYIIGEGTPSLNRTM